MAGTTCIVMQPNNTILSFAFGGRTANRANHEEFRALREARRSGTLTDEQKQKFRTLREQMKQNAEQNKAKVLAILTPEQRAQLELKKQEMEKRRQERRQMRQNRPAPSATQATP